VQIVVSPRNFSPLAENKSIFQQLFHSFCEKLLILNSVFQGLKSDLPDQIEQVISLDGIRSEGKDKNDQNHDPEQSAPGR
jgi:hypothetical protein